MQEVFQLASRTQDEIDGPPDAERVRTDADHNHLQDYSRQFPDSKAIAMAEIESLVETLFSIHSVDSELRSEEFPQIFVSGVSHLTDPQIRIP